MKIDSERVYSYRSLNTKQAAQQDSSTIKTNVILPCFQIQDLLRRYSDKKLSQSCRERPAISNTNWYAIAISFDSMLNHILPFHKHQLCLYELYTETSCRYGSD